MNLLNLVVVFGNYVLFIKIQTTGVPEYLFDLIPETNHIYNTCSSDNVTTFCSRTDVYKYSFFPFTILEWNKLDESIQQSKTIKSFRNYKRLAGPIQNLFIIYITLLVWSYLRGWDSDLVIRLSLPIFFSLSLSHRYP